MTGKPLRGAIAAALAAGLLTAVVGHVAAGPDRVPLPEGYGERFLLYNAVDRPDRNIVRFMYVSPESHAEAQADEIPYGTVLIMEDRRVELDADGDAVPGPDGRLVATEEIAAIFVMAKGEGWGEDIPPEMRNGDWDYASYLADGSPRPDATFDGCFACHMNRSGSDYNFTYSRYLRDRDLR